ncbi:S8 family serine peptidase, partial [Patescibacteria group bacterium]|nr:S8 family serine peptidase [Patescibacteria group bacterium]
MRKFRKVIFPLSVGLIFCIVLSNFNLPVLAYEKSGFNGVDFEQIRARSKSDNNGTTFDKIDSPSKEIKSLSTDSSIITKENIGLEKFKQTETKKKDYVEGEILVKYKNDKINLDTFAGRASALNFVRSKSLEKKEDLRKNNISVLKIKDNKTVEEKITELKNDPNVEYVEPNYIHPWTSMPNDTSFSELWGLHNIGQTVNGDSGADDKDINAPEAWDIFTGSDSILVGVLDSGIAYNHPDLIDNMWDGSLGCKNEDNISTVCPNHGWDYTNNDDNPLDDNGHGTHVAGTIGAEGNNGIGVVGVNWNVKIVALKVGNYAGAITGDVVKAIDFAINNNVKIINASFGGPSFSTSQYEAIERFKAFGGIFIAAAGNDGINNEGTPFYPSDYDLDNIISVAATDQN